MAYSAGCRATDLTGELSYLHPFSFEPLMNAFPLSPFIISLNADQIRVTLSDYDRITIVLRAGGPWTLKQLRGALVSLLTHNPEEESLFLQRFDDFFDSELEPDAQITPAAIESAIVELEKEKQTGGMLVSESPPPIPSKKSHKPNRRYTRRQKLLLAACGVLVVLGLCAFWTYPAWRAWFASPKPPVIQPATDEVIRATPTATPEKIALTASADPARQLLSEGSWLDYVGAGLLATAVLLLLFISYRLVSTHSRDEKTSFDPEAPQHFARGDIGGRPSPRLDDGTLSQLADSLGFFRSELAGKSLNVEASIKAGIRDSVPTLVFHKRKSLRTVLIMEDVFAEPLAWNNIAEELADGLGKRGVPVIYGKFNGVPSTFQAEGHTHWLDDLDNNRRDYLLLLFSDGKGIGQRNELTLETLSNWPMVAWMELREPRFWDESTARIARHGIPIYPATAEGLLQVTSRFLTEQGAQKRGEVKKASWRGVPPLVGEGVAAYVEKLLGDSLLWAQACAMIQPVTPGLADALRRQFQPHLPPERFGRLMLLPGTTQAVSGIKFSNPVLSALRAGFAVRWSEEKQEEILTFILERLHEVEPERADSLAHLAWECSVERVRLELEPEPAARRLWQLDSTVLHDFIRAELDNIVLPGGGNGRKAGADAPIPLRIAPRDDRALGQLAEIADKVPPPPPYSRLKVFVAVAWRGIVRLVTPYLVRVTNYTQEIKDASLFAWQVTRNLQTVRASADGQRQTIMVTLARAVGALSDHPAFLPSKVLLPPLLVIPLSSLARRLLRRVKSGQPLPPLLAVTPSMLEILSWQDSLFEKTLTVQNLGGGKSDCAVSSDQDWISVRPSAFSVDDWQMAKVSMDTAGMLPGRHSGFVILSAFGVEKRIPVVVTVMALDLKKLRRKLLPWPPGDKQGAFKWLSRGAAIVALAVAALQPTLPPNWLNHQFNQPPQLLEMTAKGENSSVILMAQAVDPDGDAFSYHWESNAPPTTSNEGGGARLDFNGIGRDSLPQSVNVTLKIADARGGNAVYTASVNIKQAEQPTDPDPTPLNPDSETQGAADVTTTGNDRQAQQDGILVLRTRMFDVNVDINGKAIGIISPSESKRLSLPPGRYEIRGVAIRSSYSIPTYTVSLSAGQTRNLTVDNDKVGFIAIQLVNTEGSFSYNLRGGNDSLQSGFRLSSGALIPTAPGRYNLTVSKPEYKDWQRTVTVVENERLALAVTMEPESSGILVVNGTNKRVLTMSVDGEESYDVAAAPEGLRIFLSPGNHYVRFLLDGKFVHQETVLIKAGEVTKIVLPKMDSDDDLSPLTINVSNADEVLVNIIAGNTSFATGMTFRGRPWTFRLPAGAYVLSLSKDGYRTVTREFRQTTEPQSFDFLLVPEDPKPEGTGFEPAKLLSSNIINPPARLARMPQNNIVLMDVEIDRDGKVTAVTTVTAVEPALEAAAEKAARNFKFKPATRDGKPVPDKQRVEVVFRGVTGS
jgi:TonB family protein